MSNVYPKTFYSAHTPLKTSAYADAIGDDADVYPIDTAILPPMIVGGSFRASGVLVALYATASGSDCEFACCLYDIATGTLIGSNPLLSETISGISKATLLPYTNGAGAAPIQDGNSGFVFWFPTNNDDPSDSKIGLYLARSVTTTGGNRRSVDEYKLVSTNALVMDATPLSRTSDLYFAYCLGRTSAGDPHVIMSKATIKDSGWPESPTDDDLITLSEAWRLELVPSFWATRPDTMLAIQCLPAIQGLPSYLVGLIGDWQGAYPSGVGASVSSPRLVFITLGGVAKWSHETGYGIARGMCVNQYGDVYVTGTQDVVNGGNYLISRYSALNIGATIARVPHGSNGLGSYATDPQNTVVLRPIWTGSALIVQDHAPTKTTVYVYDRDLNFIRSFDMSTTDVTTGPRWRVDRYSSPWVSENY